MFNSIKSLRGVLYYIFDNPSNKGQKLYRLVLAITWQIYKRIVGLPLIIKLDNGKEFIAEPRSGNSAGAIYTKLYEPEYVMFLRKHTQTNGFMVDVGAQTGLFTLLLSHHLKGGVCFEPV